MKKIVVRLGNGLGNQLFTYAAAYSFAKKNDAEIYVDDESGFQKKNKYELHNFNISAQIIDKKYKFVGRLGSLKRNILKRLQYINKKYLFLTEIVDNEKLTLFNPKQLEVSFQNTLYFEGYFQTDKYFKDERKFLLKEFSFKENIINQPKEIVSKIKNCNSVSIHLRQNKFLKVDKDKDFEKKSLQYSENNIKIIKKGVEYFDAKLNNPVYFVWSNNFDGLEKIFPSKKFILVKENINKDPAYDLYLMSLCKHFILSPSTFHYWAAYLCRNENKICLAPEKMKNESGYYGFSNNKDIKADWWKVI